MDVEELLKYQPSSSVESNDKIGSKEDGRRSSKRKLDPEIDLDNFDGPPPLDEIALKRLILQLERKVLKNQEFRIKFADDPTKFMDTEVELFDVIQEMHVISTQPELYKILVDLNVLPTIMGLLSHENTDISSAIVSFLQELSDLDNIEEIANVSTLLDAFIDGQIISQLVSNMERLDESVKEEAEAVFNSLAIIENLNDYKPQLSKDCQPLISWILQRLKAKLPFDSNKLYVSEILSILLQNNEENRKYLGLKDGIDVLLQQIAYYKRHELSDADEKEFLSNVYDSLCSSLLCCFENREIFFKGEGLELMNLILREKKKRESSDYLRRGALKVINHVLVAEKKDKVLEDCCNKFVEIFGLRSIFPIFMRPTSILTDQKKKEAKASIDEIEEHCLSIILALLKNCNLECQNRVKYKFVENDLEKTERLMELHFKYAEKLNRCDLLIKKEKAVKAANDETMNEDEVFIKRLTEGGLFTLQIIDHIILIFCDSLNQIEVNNANSSEEETHEHKIRSRIIKLLNLHATSSINHYKLIKTVMKEMADLKDEEEKNLILEIISRF